MFKLKEYTEKIKAIQITQELYDKILKEGEEKPYSCLEKCKELKIDGVIYQIRKVEEELDERYKNIYVDHYNQPFKAGDYYVSRGSDVIRFHEEDFLKFFQLKD